MSNYKPVVGELVRYTGQFLRSVGWHFDVPVNGMVLRLKSRDQIAVVRWCDGEDSMSVNVGNLERCPTDRGLTDSYRECLMREFGADMPVAG